MFEFMVVGRAAVVFGVSVISRPVHGPLLRVYLSIGNAGEDQTVGMSVVVRPAVGTLDPYVLII